MDYNRRALALLYRSPSLVSWDRLLTLLGLWVAIMLGLLDQGLSGWIAWSAIIAIPGAAIWRKCVTPDLRIFYDPLEHQELSGDGLLFVDVVVRNETGRTIHNVCLKVKQLVGINGSENSEFREQKFAIAGTSNPPYVPPDKHTTLHSGDEARFRIGRISKQPGGHNLSAVTWTPKMHGPSRVGDGPQLIGFDRTPRRGLPNERHSLTVEAQGDNARGESMRFEFWGTEGRAIFVRSER